MKLLIAIEAPAWADPASGRTEQYRRNALSKLVRDVAERIQIGGSKGEFECDELSARFEIEADEPADEAA